MFLAHEAPAGGAPLLQVFLTALIAAAFLAPTLLVVLAERRGRGTAAGRLADRLGTATGLPRWVALPSLTLTASLISAGFGVYWDVPYHIDFGRDEGPLANPSHYFILFGLLGVFSSGLLSCGLAAGPLPRRVLTLLPGWRAPLGGVIVAVSGGFGLLGFPLDDVWHRILGQDVTEWGPTHVLMIGGAVISTLGGALLVAEARQVGAAPLPVRLLDLHYALWWLLGMSAFLMEYDLGVPQFPMVAQVAITAVIGTWALVWARSAFGPGGAVLAAAAYLAARWVLMVLVGEVLGRTPHQFTLYLGIAVLVELLALVVAVRPRFWFGVAAGLLVGSLGIVSEWAWTQVFLPLPWPAAQLPLFLGYGVLAGVGGGLLGAWQLRRLDEIASPVPATRGRQYRPLLVGAVLAFGVLAVSVPRTADDTLRAELTLQQVGSGHAVVTVHLDDPAAVDDAIWFYALSWQGGGSVRAPMQQVGDGVYRSEAPLPVTGDWKTLVRIHTPANRLVALPVYLPADAAIPVAEIPAASGVTRSFGPELHLLQREAATGLPDAIWYGGYGTLLVIYLVLCGLITALYMRAATAPPRRPAEPAERPAGLPAGRPAEPQEAEA